MKAFRWTLIGLLGCFAAWFVYASNNPLTRALQPPIYGWVQVTSAADPMHAGDIWNFGPLPERFRFKVDAAYPVSYVVVPDFMFDSIKKDSASFPDQKMANGVACWQFNIYRREEDCTPASSVYNDNPARFYLVIRDNRDASAKQMATAGVMAMFHAGGTLDALQAENRVSYSIERWACVTHCNHK